MNTLYFTSPYRRSTRTIRLEYGQVKKKFVLRTFEGNINRRRVSEGSPREEVVNGLCGHKQKTMSTTIYFKGGFPPDLLYEEGISKLNFEGINFGKLKIDWKKLIG